MVQFGDTPATGYFHPMDRGYDSQDHYVTTHGHHEHGFASSQQMTNDVGVTIGDLGMSLGLGPVPNVQAVQAKLRPGAKKLEFVFTGMGKGQGQSQTPEMYGKKQREALAEIALANKVDFTTHSTVGVYGLAGMDQQGNFSKTHKDYSLQEFKRAIEFAADVAKGGPVVVHTGEFQRPIVDAEWNTTEEEPHFAGKFKMYEDEEERAAWRVVDTRTGAVQVEARKNRHVSRPIWNYAEQEYFDFDGQKKGITHFDDKGRPIDERGFLIYVDYFGKRIESEVRVPKYDDEAGHFKSEQLTWEDLKYEANQMTLEAREMWRKWKDGEISKEKLLEARWGRFIEAESDNHIKVRPEEAYLIATLETNAANSRGWSHYYGAGFSESVDLLKKLEKAYEVYKKIEDTIDHEEKWQLLRQVPQRFSDLIPPEAKYPTAIIKEQIREAKGRMSQAQEAAASQWAQAEEARETIRHIESAETYAFREACDAYALAAMTAFRQTEKLKEMGQLKRPLQIAMENLFPESYGSHPTELIELVQGSRHRFAKMLQENLGLSEDKARERAHEHITATFDMGHVNMWRKYWRADPHKTIEQNDKEFNEWSVHKLGQMIDAGVIGHIHIDDNYGYHDDHLAAGEGNAPIREMVKLLKEKNYKGSLIIEPGADYTTDVTGFHTVMKTWRHFGAPVYGKGSGISPPGATWNQVGYGWFGQNQTPYFTFGSYSPSEDLTLWSGVPLE